MTEWHMEIVEEDERIKLVVRNAAGEDAPLWVRDQVLADAKNRIFTERPELRSRFQ